MKEFKFNEFKIKKFKLKEETKMLTELEFIGKRHIILDKAVETYVMERFDKGWKIITISKWNSSEPEVSTEIVQDDKAWEFYKERMESFGYRQFPVIEE